MEINQKSNSREDLSPFFRCACSKYAINIRHFDAILTPSWPVWTLSDICRLRRLTFCWCFVLIRSYIRKVSAVRTAGGTSQDGVLMATMRCVRRHARSHQLQMCRHRVGLLVDLYSVAALPVELSSHWERYTYLIQFKCARYSRDDLTLSVKIYSVSMSESSSEKLEEKISYPFVVFLRKQLYRKPTAMF